MVDARLPDGSRVNAIIPPCAIDGSTVTIRKFSKNKLQISDLVRFGSMTDDMAEFLRACVESRLNIVVAGGTGSGKTTLLNVLSNFIPPEDRIVTIEDSAELQLAQDHVVRLEAKPAEVDGSGLVTIRDLVKNSLRMRPERIVIGECRAGETLDMLQAMNTGHDGSLTTLHANDPRSALARMETMSLMAGLDLPVRVIREQIASAIDLIVQQTRLDDGQRKVANITEVQGMEGDTVVMQDIFALEQKGKGADGRIIAELKPTGVRPRFSTRLEAHGFKLPPGMFGTNIPGQKNRW
jgi:pilus assembly protein CpaF